MLVFFLDSRIQNLVHENGTHHGFDVGMRHRVELVIFQFQVRTQIDIGPFVFRGVAVLRGGED